MRNQARLVAQYYGNWAPEYGSLDNDGWFSWVRAREAHLVSELLELRGGESILDVGCGPGLHSIPLAARGHAVWAVDLSPAMVARVEGRVERALVGDAQTLALGRTFDRILCLGVMEYVDPLPTLEQLTKHLAPGGRLIILAPRQGVGGWIYRREKAKYGLAVHLYTRPMLQLYGQLAGLKCVAERRPFWHNLLVAFAPSG